MQGRQFKQRTLFIDGDLEKFVPKNHLLRKVNQLINLSFIIELTESYYASRGRPSLDPVVFFKMQLIAYLYGIESDRRLCDEIQCNIAYRWYLGFPLEQEIPDHSTLSRVRDRLGIEVIEKIFKKIVKDCQKVGMVDGKQLISDATLIKANASKESFKPVSEPKIVTQEIEASKNNSSLSQGKNKTHQSSTDPDSTCVNRKGHGAGNLFYKGHYTIDGKSRVILDCHVTTGANHERNVYIDRIDHIQDQFNLETEECIADAGYGDGPIFEDLKDRGIKSYIPLKFNKAGAGKHAPTEGFIYDKENDRYKCPMSCYLYPHKSVSGITRYVIKNKECQNCPLKSDCISKDSRSQVAKRIQRAEYQDIYDQIRKQQQTKIFKQKKVERSWKVEGIFAEGKNSHNLARARYRGIVNMQFQVYMSAISQNIKRIVGFYVPTLDRFTCLYVYFTRIMLNLVASNNNNQNFQMDLKKFQIHYQNS